MGGRKQNINQHALCDAVSKKHVPVTNTSLQRRDTNVCNTDVSWLCELASWWLWEEWPGTLRRSHSLPPDSTRPCPPPARGTRWALPRRSSSSKPPGTRWRNPHDPGVLYRRAYPVSKERQGPLLRLTSVSHRHYFFGLYISLRFFSL